MMMNDPFSDLTLRGNFFVRSEEKRILSWPQDDMFWFCHSESKRSGAKNLHGCDPKLYYGFGTFH